MAVFTLASVPTPVALPKTVAVLLLTVRSPTLAALLLLLHDGPVPGGV